MGCYVLVRSTFYVFTVLTWMCVDIQGCQMRDPRFPCEHVIQASTSLEIGDIATFDVDKDNDVDVIVANYRTDELLVFENDGSGNDYVQHAVDVSGPPRHVYLYDVDGDGFTDFVIGGDEELGWVQNLGNNSYVYHRVDSFHVQALFAVDFDDDNYTDIVAVEYGSTESPVTEFRVYSTLGTIEFVRLSTVSTPATRQILNVASYYFAVGGGDFRGILVSEYNKTWLLTFDDGLLTPTSSDLIYEREGYPIGGIVVATLDNEFANNLLMPLGISDAVVYLQPVSVGGTSLEWREVVIDEEDRGDSTSVTVAVDVDHDGDIDVVVAREYEHQLSWYENLGTGGNFSAWNLIHHEAVVPSPYAIECHVIAMTIGDLNGDGWDDIVFACNNIAGPRLSWYPQGEYEHEYLPL